MLSGNTLRNIHKKDFIKFFSRFNVTNRTVRINQGADRYTPIQKMLVEELQGGDLTGNNVDDFLFDQLFYAVNNWHFVYENHDISQSLVNGTQEEIIKILEGIEGISFNNLLINDLGNADYTVCTTRVEFSNQKLGKIHFLIKVGVYIDQNERVNFFSGVTIDIESGIVVIRFNQHILDQYEDDAMDVLKNIKEMLNGVNRYGIPFEILNFNVIGLNEEKPKKMVSKLFKEVSSEAEEILNRQVPENTENDIREFLEGKGLPCTEDYIQQIKSVIFQEIANDCANTMFPNGWAFRFIFREGLYTRASSRTDNRSPIYGSKVYWHLKELIFNNEEMQEAGLHWYLDDPTTTENPNFVQVRFESRLDTLIIHYYYRMREERKEKEDYVLRKISEYF